MHEEEETERLENGRLKMVKASVPNFFMCPISLELMQDPVTLTTGQTYDRQSIEKWFAKGHNTCPSTMQVLRSMDTAPNHTLRKLIQHWRASTGHGQGAAVEVVIPTLFSTNLAKRLPVAQMLQEVATRGAESFNYLKTLRSLAKDLNQGFQNRKVLAEAGAIPILANFIFSPKSLGKDVNACEEALGILTLLPLQGIRKLVHIGTKQLTALSWVLNRGSLDGRVNAALLLGSLANQDDEMKASVGNTAGIFEGLVQLVKEDLYVKAVEAGLKATFTILSSGPDGNVIRAVEAGVVFAVVDRLLETERRRQVQTLSKMMELLCSSAEGREAAIAHVLVVPLLVKIIISNSPVASESAVSCLWSICQQSPNTCVDEAAGQDGLLTQLSRLVDLGDHRINPSTKLRAAELLQQLRQSFKSCSG